MKFLKKILLESLFFSSIATVFGVVGAFYPKATDNHDFIDEQPRLINKSVQKPPKKNMSLGRKPNSTPSLPLNPASHLSLPGDKFISPSQQPNSNSINSFVQNSIFSFTHPDIPKSLSKKTNEPSLMLRSSPTGQAGAGNKNLNKQAPKAIPPFRFPVEQSSNLSSSGEITGVDETYTFQFQLSEITEYELDHDLEATIDSIRLNKIRFVDELSTDFNRGNSFGLKWDIPTGSLSYDSTQSNRNFITLNQDWVPLPMNLISYWNFNHSWEDQIGNNDGIPVLGATFSTDSKAGTHSASLTSKTVSMSGPAITGNFSISLWFKSSTTPTNEELILDFHPTTRFKVGFMGANKNYLSLDDGSLRTINTMSLTNNRWHHLCITQNEGNVTVYINAVSMLQFASTLELNANNLRLGNENFGFNGLIDELAIWNTFLSPSQVGNIYQEQLPTFNLYFDSRLISLSENKNWNFLSLSPSTPSFKELPNKFFMETNNEYPEIVTNSLLDDIIGVWHFNNNLNDSSGNNYHAVSSSNISHGLPGKLQNAISFNSSTVYLPEVISPHPTNGQITISLWIKVKDPAGTGARIVEDYGNDGMKLVLMGLNSSSKVWFYMRDSAAQAVSLESTHSINDNHWHHIVGTRIGSSLYLYIDGQLDTTGTNLSMSNFQTNDGAPPKLGHFFYTGYPLSTYYKGQLDELAIWKRGLSADEVKSVYQRGASQVSLQLKTCSTTANCSIQNWFGEHGTSTSYFTELNNNSQPNTKDGDVINLNPEINLDLFFNPVLSSKVLQYRLRVKSEHSSSSLIPKVKKVFFAESSFDTNSRLIQTKTGKPFKKLKSLSFITGPLSCSSEIKVNFSINQTDWYYWNGVNWILSNNSYMQANTTAELTSSVLALFTNSVGEGNVYLQVHLKSDGTTGCDISQASLEVLK